MRKNVSVVLSAILFLCAAVKSEDPKCYEASSLKYDMEKILVIGKTENYFLSQLIQHGLVKHLERDICPGGVNGLIEATKLLPNKYIINTAVHDFYKFNYNYVSEHLIYAGDTVELAYGVEACVVDFQVLNTTEPSNITCDESVSRSYRKVKLISGNVRYKPELHELVKNYMSRDKETIAIDNIVPNTVLICNSDLSLINIEKHIHLNIKQSDDCENDMKTFQNELLAVLAPKPFETDYDVLAPVVLYKAPCYDEMNLKANNYVSLISSCDAYKHALMELIRAAGWTRVAIISDNTPYSESTEKEIKALFSKDGIIYTVKRCMERQTGTCNFTQALKSLKDSDARVYIANVDENNLQIIYEQIAKLWKGKNKLYSWITRDYLSKPTWKMGDVFTINLAPSITNFYIFNGMPNINERKASIIEGITRINYAYKKIKNQYDIRRRRPFFEQLAQIIRERNISSEITAYVIKKGKSNTEVLTMKNGIVGLSKNQYRADIGVYCPFKSGDFHQPCENGKFLAIMVILVIVAGCALFTTIFYSYYVPPTRNQYINL